jgi:hypothetical protein
MPIPNEGVALSIESLNELTQIAADGSLVWTYVGTETGNLEECTNCPSSYVLTLKAFLEKLASDHYSFVSS